MKPALLLLLGSAILIGPLAAAQEQITVCLRSTDGSCVWVNQEAAPQTQVLQPVEPASSSWPYLDPGYPQLNPDGRQIVAPDPFVDDLESEVWFDWEPAPPLPDPTLNKPGVCAFSASRARARFEAGMRSNNINKIIEAYDWHGKSSKEAERIVERLDAIPRYGTWEKSVITGWVGEDPGQLPNDFWRWQGNGELFYFNMRQVSGCWFVSFGEDPGQLVMIQRKRQEQIRARSQPVSKEPGVYEF